MLYLLTAILMTETKPSLLIRLRQGKRWRVELLYAAICLAVGLSILPAAIYVVGLLALGPYSGGPHLGSFYGDYWRNLLGGSARTWLLALSPLLLLTTMRLIFGWRVKPAATPAAPEPTTIPPTPATTDRREPFVSG
jgi:hypothetical protein